MKNNIEYKKTPYYGCLVKFTYVKTFGFQKNSPAFNLAILLIKSLKIEFINKNTFKYKGSVIPLCFSEPRQISQTHDLNEEQTWELEARIEHDHKVPNNSIWV